MDHFSSSSKHIDVGYPIISESEINLFLNPERIILGGSSGSGKTTLVCKLVNKYRDKFAKVYVIGTDLDCPDIIRNDAIDPFEEENHGNHYLYIYDDQMLNSNVMLTVSKIASYGRHKNISVILLVQNIFHQDKYFRLISLNTTRVILFRMRDKSQIAYFARTFLDKKKIPLFVDLYKKEVIKKKYGYLLIDFTGDSDDILAIRSNIANEGLERVFKL